VKGQRVAPGESIMAICMQCGNELLGTVKCTVCAAGRGGVKLAPSDAVDARRPHLLRCRCPYCEHYLETEDWEGIRVLSCPECRGTFFPDHALESVLNQLRAGAETLEVSAVLADFRKRFTRKLPPSVRYRNCPVCEDPMLRSNYGTVSGVIVHVCGDHGTFVNEMEFANLAEFIVRGGDQLADHARKIHVRITHNREHAGRTILDHFFGSRG
jgi:Zn-finger nucleic acid-binding protein